LAASNKVGSDAPSSETTVTPAPSDNDVVVLDNQDEGRPEEEEDGEDEPASILVRDVTTTTSAPAVVTVSPTRLATPAEVIAAAPLTPSTARFIASAAPFPFGPTRQFFGAPLPATAVGGPVFGPAGPLLAAPVAGQGGHHLLADSNTAVFKGFFTYPGAGIDFDF
jgi:hypothetical protein